MVTGKPRGSGTNANVFINIYGENGDTGQRFLDGPKDDFERGSTGVYGVQAVDLGRLTKIRFCRSCFFFIHFSKTPQPKLVLHSYSTLCYNDLQANH